MARYAVPTPTGKPARGGLLPVANVIRDGDDVARAGMHGVTYVSELCGQNRRYVEGEEKIPDDLTRIEGDPFTVYRFVEGSLFDEDLIKSAALQGFNAGETFAVERGLQETVLNGPDTVDITPVPGTPVTNMKHALGLLEQYAAERYLGLPLIHGNRFATSLLPDREAGDNFELHTINGTPIANGGGYSTEGPGAVSAAAGTAWVYISGQVNIWAEKPREEFGRALTANKAFALVEASYTATIDCFVAAILVGI